MTQPACLVLAELGAADELRWWVWHCPLETCKHTSGAQPGTAYAPWVPQHRCKTQTAWPQQLVANAEPASRGLGNVDMDEADDDEEGDEGDEGDEGEGDEEGEEDEEDEDEDHLYCLCRPPLV